MPCEEGRIVKNKHRSESDRLIEEARRLARRHRVARGGGFRLAGVDPGDTGKLGQEDKPKAKGALQSGVELLARLQEMLYAQNRWAVLLIFQAMDAAGKDSAIKHVMSGINPQGCQVFSFKAPSAEELDHDYLWRCMKRLPERGRIGIFNRSYYEETLVVRVHPELLANQKLPERLVDPKQIWKQRFEDIRCVERYLTRNGVVVRKFFLHVSRKEQRNRFLARIDDPAKNWKFSADDMRERGFWPKYMKAYEDMIRHTATPHAPWYVVPADHKWYTRVVVASAIVEALASLGLGFPRVDSAQLEQLQTARRALQRDD